MLSFWPSDESKSLTKRHAILEASVNEAVDIAQQETTRGNQLEQMVCGCSFVCQ